MPDPLKICVDVSFIIPAFNEEKYILRTLRSIARQKTNLKYEIIVVDNGSTDRTVELAKRYARVIHQKEKGIAATRNLGAKHAKGRLLIFVDADTYLPRNYLSKVWKRMNEGVVALTARIRFQTRRNTPKETRRVLSLATKVVNAILQLLSKIGKTKLAGVNTAVWKDAFNKVGGFPNVPSEDVAFSKNIRKLGKTEFYMGTYVITSSRRFEDTKNLAQAVVYYLTRDVISGLKLSNTKGLNNLGKLLEKKVGFSKYRGVR